MSNGSFLGSLLGSNPNSKKVDERPIDKDREHDHHHDHHEKDELERDAERQKQWLDFEKQSNSILYNQLAKDSRSSSYNPAYIKYCKPVAVVVLVISVILLIYVIITSIRNRSNKVITAGLQQPIYQNQIQVPKIEPVSPQPVGGRKGKKSKFMKNMIKGGKRILKKMSGGDCSTCSQGFKY